MKYIHDLESLEILKEKRTRIIYMVLFQMLMPQGKL